MHTVGVTCTGNTYAPSYALVSSETTENYIWDVRQVNSALVGPPEVVVIETKKALIKAIHGVWHQIVIVVCRCHL